MPRLPQQTRTSLVLPGLLVCLITLVGMSAGCSSKPKASPTNGQAISGTDEQIFIGDTIEKNYDPNVIMKRAEAFFDKEDYPEAIIEYQHFLDLHRVHTLAYYAQFKLAESHYKQIKTIDRDPDPVYKALEAYEKLRKEYPGNRYDAEATDRIRSCHSMIAQAYLFVGQFYYRRDAFLAAAHRFESILKLYPDMDVAADALYYLALTYQEIGADDWAKENLIALAQRFPQSAHTSAGQKLLAKLNSKQPAETIAQSTAPASDNTGPEVIAKSNGSMSPSATPSLAPATSLRSTPNASPSPESTLCRLGVWC